MDPRLPRMLKDAALAVFVAAALGIFIVGFRTVDVGSRTGLSFDYHLVDLGVALVVIFFGRLGLSLAAMGLRWPAIALGIVMIAAGASPMKLPSGFLHWFVALGGVLLVIRAVWPWADRAIDDRGPHADRPRRRQDRHRVAGLGAAGHRHRDAVHAVRRPEDDGSRRADPDLRDAGLGPQHRGRPGGPARSRLRRLLRRRRLCLCAAEHAIRAGFLDRAAAGRRLRCDLRHPAGLSGAAPARRLPRHRHPGLRRDHPPGPAQLGRSHQWSGRHRHDPGSDPVRRGVRRDRTCGRQADRIGDAGHSLRRHPPPDLPLLHHPGAGADHQHLHPAHAPPAGRPRLGGAARGRDGLQGAGHQSDQHQAHGVRRRRHVRGLRRLVLRRQAALHQSRELHLHRIRRSSSPSSCWAAWAARSAWCWRPCC